MKLSHKSVLLTVLWITWFLLLPTLFAVSAVVGDGGRFEPFKCTSSLILAIAAWTNAYFQRDGRWSRFAAWVAVGMTCGMLADLYGTHFAHHFELHALSVTVPLFALGHVAYIGGMLDVGAKCNSQNSPRGVEWLCCLPGSTV